MTPTFLLFFFLIFNSINHWTRLLTLFFSCSTPWNQVLLHLTLLTAAEPPWGSICSICMGQHPLYHKSKNQGFRYQVYWQGPNSAWKIGITQSFFPLGIVFKHIRYQNILNILVWLSALSKIWLWNCCSEHIKLL